jgi:hypothetical protein
MWYISIEETDLLDARTAHSRSHYLKKGRKHLRLYEQSKPAHVVSGKHSRKKCK